MKIHMLVIDPQNDFCDPSGALFVPGADEDMNKLSTFVNTMQSKIDDIHVTLDSHMPLHIAHPIMWVDSNGNHPQPFTLITSDEVANGRWRTARPLIYNHPANGKIPWGQHYTEQLKSQNRYVLCIWPPHCLIGSVGGAVYPKFFDALVKWQENRFGLVNYVTKGSNFKTEHYSAVKADVEDPMDMSTQLNMSLINMLNNPEIVDIIIAGEALSHCVANTITDIANVFGDENIRKFVLLEDCCSNVPGFEQQGIDFINTMKSRGMRVTTSVDYVN